MPGLAAELYNRCRATLLQCGEFNTNASLRTVFITGQLYPFRDHLPGADSKAARVDAVLGYLLDQQISGGIPCCLSFYPPCAIDIRPATPFMINWTRWPNKPKPH